MVITTYTLAILILISIFSLQQKRTTSEQDKLFHGVCKKGDFGKIPDYVVRE